jgi:hypothetical protein
MIAIGRKLAYATEPADSALVMTEGQDARHEDGGPLDVSARQVRADVGHPDQQQDHQREGEGEQRILGAAPKAALLKQGLPDGEVNRSSHA